MGRSISAFTTSSFTGGSRTGWCRGRLICGIVQAHRIHHAVESPLGAVSFGFIYAPPVEVLKARLAASEGAEVRAPRRASTAPRG